MSFFCTGSCLGDATCDHWVCYKFNEAAVAQANMRLGICKPDQVETIKATFCSMLELHKQKCPSKQGGICVLFLADELLMLP